MKRLYVLAGANGSGKSTISGGSMPEIVERITRIGNTAVHAAQEENRRKGIPNVYVINGTIVWQMPDGSITTVHP